jgi:hypothetical protein
VGVGVFVSVSEFVCGTRDAESVSGRGATDSWGALGRCWRSARGTSLLGRLLANE